LAFRPAGFEKSPFNLYPFAYFFHTFIQAAKFAAPGVAQTSGRGPGGPKLKSRFTI
jgi:hypothetical protein